VLRIETEPVDRYAARWLAGPAPLSPAARERRLAAWMRHYERAGIRAISTGLWTLRRRRADRHLMLIDDAPDLPTLDGAAVAARLAALTAGAPRRRRRGTLATAR
jgi:hypothetical protein